MKKFLSVILAAVLVTAVGGSLVSGVFAGFTDVELSAQNFMCAGTRTLEVSGGPIVVEKAWPCKWFSEEYILLNTGSLPGTAYIHFPAVDGSWCGTVFWKGIRCEEAGTVKGMVYDRNEGGSGYRTPVGDEPVGPDVATSESELVAEEGGCVGEDADGNPVIVPGMGQDTCNLADFIEVRVYFEDVLKVSGNLSAIACTDFELGLVPAYEGMTVDTGGGWGSYFTYQVGGGPIEVSLVGGQIYSTGLVKIWDDGTNLYVEYNTSGTGWTLSETHIYAEATPPLKLNPGGFEYGDDSLPHVTYYLETIPLSDIFGVLPSYDGKTVYLAVHAVVCHPDYGCETAWGKGVYRKVRIELHFDDIPEGYFKDADWWPDGKGFFDEDNPAEAKWDHWVTNAYMGDRCIFDIVFKLLSDC